MSRISRKQADHLSVGTATALGLFTVSTSSATTTATFAQYGSGDILNLFDGTTEVLTVANGGNAGIGSTTPTANLSIQGTSGQTANLFAIASSTGEPLVTVSSSGQVTAPLGSAAVPSYSFGGDPDTGLYATVGALRFSVGGVSAGRISSAGFQPIAGTASLPGLASSNDPNTGLFWSQTDDLGISTGGAERVRVDSSGFVWYWNIYSNHTSHCGLKYVRQTHCSRTLSLHIYLRTTRS